MRLWSLHPRHLDAQGLVALWRESLLAKKVLEGKTRGYRHHPQLVRFRSHPKPLAAINSYLAAILGEAERRGYRFDAKKIGRSRTAKRLNVTRGQVLYEWKHLTNKLKARSPAIYRIQIVTRARAHPLFRIKPGHVEPWERPGA